MTRLSSAGASARTGHRVGSPDRRATAILATKLAPPEPGHATVARPRLTTLLAQHVQRCPVTLLSGPAGSGKTRLAADWRRGQGARWPTGWVTLDEYDDDPATFWSYVFEALSGVGVQLSEVPEGVAGEPPPGGLVPRLAADLAASPRPVVLVLDHADHLTDRSIIAGLDLLVQNAGHRLRLVLAGRADPALPLHRYRLAGTLAEIRTDELGFTPEETQDLLSALGAPVTPEVAAALCAQTQGWAVGLRLAAAPLRQGVPPEQLFTSLARDDGSVAQYLVAEVLEGQSAGVRRVLLRTSVTAELWPDLVDRLCGRRNVRRVLAGLVHANAFVEASPGVPGGFRIHPLFQEMLQGQLAFNHPGELAGLHRICAEWYAEQGQSLTALGHAVAAEDWALVGRLIVDDLWVPRLLAHGTDPLSGGLRSLPASLPGPEAAVLRTVAAVTGGRRPAPADVTAAEQAQQEGRRPALRISAGLAVLTAQAGTDGDPSTLLAGIDAVAALVAELPDDEGRTRRDCAAVLGDLRGFAISRTDAPTGQLENGLRSAAATAQSAGARRLRARAVGRLALVEAVAGHLTRAAQLAGEAEAFAAEEGADEAARDPAPALALAWVHLRRYALAEAREWLARVGERAASGGARAAGLEALHAVLQGEQFRLRHEYDAADQLLRPHVQAPRAPRWIAEQVVGEAVRLAVARGHVEEALRTLADGSQDEPWRQRLRATVGLLTGAPTATLPAGAGPPDSLSGLVEASVIRACQLMEAGHLPAAADELVVALDLARPELLRWPFVDTPPQARRLLRTHPRLQEPSAWLNPSSGAQPGGGRPSGPAATEDLQVLQDLSDREMEVLRHLAEMLSTAEIAATMFISVNTVRTHIRSILRKLSVTRRNQAVRRARDRGLL
jgi:LuxR family maltose regulon positive regulatory protein